MITTALFSMTLTGHTATAPPISCVNASFAKTSTSNWNNISLKLTNNCATSLDFGNTQITFNNADNLNTSFWGDFAPLQYPDNNLQITSAPGAEGKYISSLSLHIPEESWANRMLPPKSSITIKYGATLASYDPTSVKVYLNTSGGGGSGPTYGSIKVTVPTLPSALVGYTGTPSVVAKQDATGTLVTTNTSWNTTVNIPQLADGASYSLSTPDIITGSAKCKGSFNPAIMQSSSSSPLTSNLTYTCTQSVANAVSITVSGLPATVSTLALTFTPLDGSAAVTKQVSIVDGKGTGSVNLPDGVSYNITSTAVAGYTISYSAQPLISRSGSVENISFQIQQASKKSVIAGYVPGWKTPPTAASLASAGYTHAMIAFGLFSTSAPGEVVFPYSGTITKSYIDSLHSAGIKAILSLGGASTSINNTTVDFHQAISLAASPTAFQSTFVQSLKNLIAQYGFDGVDIDIEHGLVGSGSFAAPTGDIAVMASILNTLHQSNPSLLITLTPQVANVAATSGFDGIWGNYASLIMQTSNALSWVGVQVYNTGCAYGIDHICYPDDANSPDLSVAMAVAILESWPQKDASGRATGFQPYVGRLAANQVLLGYPAPNASGISDGLPTKSTAVIKRAIECLKTGVVSSSSCDKYVPPRTYTNVGGVFEWEVTYDQDNNFKFAKDLKDWMMA